MSNGNVNLLLFGSVNGHHRVPVNKQFYINKANFLLHFFTYFIRYKANRVNFLNFTYHFDTIFTYFINLY